MPQQEVYLPEGSDAMRMVSPRRRHDVQPTNPSPVVVETATRPIASPSRFADQIEIHRLLRNVFHGPSAAEYQAQLDAPGYDAQQRIVLRLGSELAAHVRYVPARMQYDSLDLPVAWLMDLATAPQFRKRGFASAVVAMAEEHAARAGAVLGIVRTTEVEFFLKRGWGVCGQHSFSLVDACRLLATLGEAATRIPRTILPGERITPDFYTRPIRRLDLPELLRLEKLRCHGSFGTFVRSQSQWEWLLERGACEEMVVAERGGRLAGYIIACEGRIAELMTEEPTAAPALLSHIAHNAFERGKLALRYDGPPHDPIHALCVAAGGRTVCQPYSGGEAYCVKVFNPRRLLELTSPVWKKRGQQAEGELLLELAGGETFQLQPATGEVSVPTKAAPRARLQLTPAHLGPLVLGQLTRSEQSREFSLAAANKKAALLAASLFPPQPLYFPAFDQLMAR